MPSNFVSCSSIGTHCIQRNDECRIVVIDGIVINIAFYRRKEDDQEAL